MKKGIITAFILFAAAFLLLFSFQKDKNRINSAGKKINAIQEWKIQNSGSTKIKSADKPATAMQEVKVSESEQASAPANETIETFFKEMPRTSELLNASAEELHGTPKAVLAAGEKLADIHEYFSEFPQARDVEMSFYLKCSQQKDFFESIRAVCAARLSQQYFEATGHEISVEMFDKNIDQLRREINL